MQNFSDVIYTTDLILYDAYPLQLKRDKFSVLFVTVESFNFHYKGLRFLFMTSSLGDWAGGQPPAFIGH